MTISIRLIILMFAIVSMAVWNSGCDAFYTDDDEINDTATESGMRLSTAEEDIDNNGSLDRVAVLIYNDDGYKIEKSVDEHLVHYYYSEKNDKEMSIGNPVNESSADCVEIFNDKYGNIGEKRLGWLNKNNYCEIGYIIHFIYDKSGNIIEERHVIPSLDGDHIDAIVRHRYAFKDSSQTKLIPVETTYVLTEKVIRLYYRYGSSKDRPDSLEYDFNGDLNIDLVTHLTYDIHGNRIMDKTFRFETDGEMRPVSTTRYSWEDGPGYDRDVWEIWDEGKATMLSIQPNKRISTLSLP